MLNMRDTARFSCLLYVVLSHFARAIYSAFVWFQMHGKGIGSLLSAKKRVSEDAQTYSLLVPSPDASQILRLQLAEDSLLRIPCAEVRHNVSACWNLCHNM